MPNWTANRLYFNPSTSCTKKQVIAAMDTTGFSELLAHGVHSARALFLLVFSGVIRVRGDCYGHAPLNWMTKFGGARVDFNKPVDEEVSELVLILNGVFDTDKLTRLVAFASARKFFDTVDSLAECTVTSESWKQSMDLFGAVYFDYCSDMYTAVNRTHTINDRYFGWLNYYYNRDDEVATETLCKKDYDGYHSMLSVIPPDILPEINGFNGRMNTTDDRTYRSRSPTSRDSYIQRYGTKWPGFTFTVGVSEGKVYLDFETAWSPPNERYFDLLSEKVPQLEEIYYAEQGIGFCGSGLVLHPGTVFWRNADLKIEYDDEDLDEVVCKVISPDWIVGKVGNYGG